MLHDPPQKAEPAPTLKNWNFAPSAAMSPALDAAVHMVAPIHVKADESANLSPIAGYRKPGTIDPTGKGQEWWTSPQGRLSTRLFSRGLAGSLAYAVASIAQERAMKNYDMTKAIGNELQYGAMGGGSNKVIHRFIRGIAKSYDYTLGKAVYGAVKLFTGSEEKALAAVTFRNTRSWGVKEQLGRSLGHEIVDVAFNFAAASVGDAMGRNFAQMIDPHKEISWLKDGHFDWQKCMLAQGKAAWKIFTYNQGEDWFSTMFYVYTMKAQRKAMDHFSPGFRHVFDNGNADAYKVDAHGKIVGDYFWQNIIDYQIRFTNYNVLTLMYREIYNSVGDRINHWVKTGELPKAEHAKTTGEAVGNFFGGVKDFGVYVGRSVMKGYLLMTFTVPFFSFIRVPQAKYRALAIHPGHGPMMIAGSQALGGRATALTPNFRDNMAAGSELSDGNRLFTYNPKTEQFFAKGNDTMKLHFWDEKGHNPSLMNPYAMAYSEKEGRLRWYDPYQKTEGLGPIRQVSNAAGRISYNISRAAYDWLVDVRYGMNFNQGAGTGSAAAKARLISDQALKEATLYHINSAIAYTPYFAAKTEFAELWDKQETDAAMDRLMRGIFTFSPGELAGGAKDTVNAILHPGKTAGLGSVYGVDVNPNAGWMPWSKKVDRTEKKIPHDTDLRKTFAANETTQALANQAMMHASPEAGGNIADTGHAAKLGDRKTRTEKSTSLLQRAEKKEESVEMLATR